MAPRTRKKRMAVFDEERRERDRQERRLAEAQATARAAVDFVKEKLGEDFDAPLEMVAGIEWHFADALAAATS